MTSLSPDLLERIQRLEALDEIRQLASKYALSIDMRDFDALTNLYTEDTRVSATERGRGALKRVFSKVMRQFDATSHQIGNHVIEFNGADRANGVVYCYCQHEMGDKWVVMQMLYFDRYKRVEGRWHFEWRLPCGWYAVDVRDTPAGPRKIRWPGVEPRDGEFHAGFPSFETFARDVLSGETPVRPINLDRFIEDLRQGHPLPAFASMAVRPPQTNNV